MGHILRLMIWHGRYTVKSVLSGHSKRTPKLVFKTEYRLMQVKRIAECSDGSILQFFRPSLNYHWSLRSVFCLFMSGRLRQGLLYCCFSVRKILITAERLNTIDTSICHYMYVTLCLSETCNNSDDNFIQSLISYLPRDE